MVISESYLEEKGMKKRIASMALVSALVMGTLAGCSNQAPTSTSQPDESSTAQSTLPESEPAGSGEFSPADAGNVTLRFAWWGSDARHEATLKAMDLYMKLYPNVTIEGEYQGYDGYQQKLMTQFAGGTEPDLMQLDYYWNPEWKGQENLFVDMANTPLVNLSQFQKSAIDDYMTVNGKVIGLPMNSSGFGVMINKAFFDKHSIPVDTVWTWEDMIEAGGKINKENPGDHLLAIESGTTTGGICPFILNAYVYSRYGHYWADENGKIIASKEELTNAFDILQQLFVSGTAQPLGEASLFTGQMEQNPKWINGEIGFTVDWTATVGKYKASLPEGQFAVGKPPFAKNGDNQDIRLVAGMGLGVSARSKNVEVATHFANWLMSDPDASLLMGTQRSVPNNFQAFKALVDAGAISEEITQMLDWAETAPAAPVPLIEFNSEVGDIAKDICEQVVYGQLTPEQAADRFLTDVQAKMDTVR